MKSILQDDPSYCFLCGRNSNFEPLDEHHVFEGIMRKKSEKYGLKVYLHHNTCHIFGENAVHANRDVDLKLKRYAQKQAMKKYNWTSQDFIEAIGKSFV